MRQQMQINSSMNSRMTERFQVGGAMLVKLFGNFQAEQERFADKAGKVRDLGIRTTLYSKAFSVTFTFVAALGTVLVYWMGGRMIIGGTLGLGTIFAFSLLLSRLYSPLRGLSDIPVDIKTALVSFDRVFEVLDFPTSIEERPGAVDLPERNGHVEFKNVWFRYPSGAAVSIPSLEEGSGEASSAEASWVLRDVCFAIKPGRMAALVGPSGGGKTTISMLVPRTTLPLSRAERHPR